jgi:hypothetical protein
VRTEPSEKVKSNVESQWETKDQDEEIIIVAASEKVLTPQSLRAAATVAPEGPDTQAQAPEPRAAWGGQGGPPTEARQLETPVDECFGREISQNSYSGKSRSSSKSSDANEKLRIPARSSARSASKQSSMSNLSALSKVSQASAGSSQGSNKKMTRYGLAMDTGSAPLVKEPEPEVEPGSSDSVHSEQHRSGCCSDSEHVEEMVNTVISAVFMLLVGLAMPALIGNNAEDNSGGLSAGTIALHIALVTVLMIIGKMFPMLCYRNEVTFKQRLGLCLGMCPRGEVGASIIVISLELGVKGPSVIISMCALGINLVSSGVFIFMVKYLVKDAGSMFDGLDLDDLGLFPEDCSFNSAAKPLDDRVVVENVDE